MHNPSLPRHKPETHSCFTVIPFQVAHLDLLEWRQFDQDVTLCLPTFPQQVETWCANSNAVTVIADGRVLACGGLNQISDGACNAWLFTSIHLSPHIRQFVKEVKPWIRRVGDTLGAHRIQTVCHGQDLQGIKWVKTLGFVAEGILRKYDIHESDYIMLSMVKEGDAWV